MKSRHRRIKKQRRYERLAATSQLSMWIVGYAFTVCIRTENQNQTSFYPFVPHEISVLVELILGHLRYLLTDVPPQPNSPPDNVLRPDRPAEASLGSKRRGCYPASDSRNDEAFGYLKRVIVTPAVYPRLVEFLHFDIQSTGQKSHCVSIRKDHRDAFSELAVRRPGKALERAVPSPSPSRHEAVRSRHVSGSSSPPTVDGFGTGTPDPSPQSQSFSRTYGSILPTSLAYIVPLTRGCSPWRPDAVMSTTGRERHSVLRIFKGRRECTGHHATCGALPAAGPDLRLRSFQGGQAICTDGCSARARALGFAATAAPSYSSRPGSCPDGRSFAPIPKSDERFARQYRCGPPPEFPLASPRSGIVHHLSGPDRHAHTRTLLRRSRSVGCAPVRDPANQLPYALRFSHPLTRTHVRLLGPCFKTGRMGSPQADALSTQMPRHAVRRVLQTKIKEATSPRA
ncbi:hypothetical protein Bca101_095958 [Brassica carinata]